MFLITKCKTQSSNCTKCSSKLLRTPKGVRVQPGPQCMWQHCQHALHWGKPSLCPTSVILLYFQQQSTALNCSLKKLQDRSTMKHICNQQSLHLKKNNNNVHIPEVHLSDARLPVLVPSVFSIDLHSPFFEFLSPLQRCHSLQPGSDLLHTPNFC